MFELSGWSLQAEALGVGDGDGEFVLELLPGAVGRQADLVETRVRDGQPAETQRGKGKTPVRVIEHNCQSNRTRTPGQLMFRSIS